MTVMTDAEMRKIFSTKPPSEYVQQISKERADFEKWFETVAKQYTSWNGSVPVSVWQFSKEEINNAHLLWSGWLARSDEK